MKKIFLAGILFIVVFSVWAISYRKYFSQSFLPVQKTIHTQMKKPLVPQAPYTPEKDIQDFMNEEVTGIKLQARDPHNILQGGEAVDHYTDDKGRLYDVLFSANKVIIYFAQGNTGTSKSLITFQQAQDEAKQVMEKNMPEFDTFVKTATYTPEQNSGLYILNWVGNKKLTQVQQVYFQQKQPPQYHMQVVLDQYGNLKNYDNEFLGNG